MNSVDLKTIEKAIYDYIPNARNLDIINKFKEAKGFPIGIPRLKGGKPDVKIKKGR